MADWVDVTLRLELGDGVPSGVVVAAGASQPFRGWLELLRRVEEARSSVMPRSACHSETAACDE